MREIIRTNDPVVLSLVEAVLGEAGIFVLIADRNMSVLEGSVGILPQRVLIDEDDLERARRLLCDAGLADWLRDS